MAEHDELYQRAIYYDIIFDRDVRCEVDFIGDSYRAFAGQEVQSVLDVACGPGYHAREFARRGVRAVGLDLRPEMIEFAKAKDTREGVSIEWIAQDMRSFQLEQPVDLAFIAFDGLDALLKNEDIVEHFQAVARNLNPRGTYLIDLSHPRDVSYHHYKKFRYSGERNGVKVEIRWAINDPHYDLSTAIAHTELEVCVDDHGRQQVITDAADERLFFPQDINLLAEMSSALRMVGTYGNYDLNQPLDFSDGSERMLILLQKIEP